MTPRGEPASLAWALALPLSRAPIVALDLEMTGLDPEDDRIIEIGAVRAVGGRVEARLDTLVRPGVPMTDEAREMTGLDDAALAGAPPFAEVAPALNALLDGALLVGHRVDFDHAFLAAACARAGLPAPAAPAFDSLEISRNLLSLRSNSLASVCEVLGVPRPVAHRAMPDAEATLDVLHRLLALLDPSGEATVGDLRAQVAALRPASPARRGWRDQIEAAHRARRSVWLRYVSRDEQARPVVTLREIEPWDLRAGRVAGFCHLRGAHRVFRLDRVCGVTPGDRAYEIPRERPALVR